MVWVIFWSYPHTPSCISAGQLRMIVMYGGEVSRVRTNDLGFGVLPRCGLQLADYLAQRWDEAVSGLSGG